MGKTKIDYLTHSWNPIAMRCTPCSPGCLNCWHLRMCKRLANNPLLLPEERLAYAGGPFYLNQRKLEAPLHWRKPARVGVQFMGDWMHPNIDYHWLDRMYEVIQACPQHTFFTLTKRPERLRDWSHGDNIPNLWLGVTVCNQEEANTKIPELLKIPGFKKWISIEPMLGTINVSPFFGWTGHGSGLPRPLSTALESLKDLDGISFVVAGSETGPGARPAHPDWFRSLRDQCQAAGVPFFLKRLSDGSQDLGDREWNELP